ncbi:hypothetical protein KJ691_04990 [bacterium]|nr:hypothetical protein [bacterium]
MILLSGCSSKEAMSPEASKAVQTAKAPAKLVHIEKMGFLTLERCAEAGEFLDCYLENYACGSNGCYEEFDPGVFGKIQIVLYSHVDGISYKVDVSKIDPALIDKGINRNDVTLIGEYDAEANILYATEFKAPPPPKKSFFKGCL